MIFELTVIIGTFGLSGAAFAGLIGAGVSAGAAIYGANKQSKDNKAANAQNAESQAEQNRIAWANYLMTRGVNPAGAATGQLPSNPQAINSRLPLWANVQRQGTASRGFRIPGRNAGPRLSAGAGFSTAATDPAAAVAADGKPSGSQRVANFLDPLNVSVGKNKNFLDPLGLFG